MPISITKRDTPLSYMPPPEPIQPEVQTSSAASSDGPRKCRGGCKEFSKSGSNAYIDTRTCKQCGTVTKTSKEKEIIDQATCPHTSTERSGSSRKTSRVCSVVTLAICASPTWHSQRLEDQPVWH